MIAKEQVQPCVLSFDDVTLKRSMMYFCQVQSEQKEQLKLRVTYSIRIQKESGEYLVIFETTYNAAPLYLYTYL